MIGAYMSAHVFSYRGDLIENRHTASIAIVNPAGALIAYAGNPQLPAHLRSSSKPFQAQVLFLTNAVGHFGLTPKEIAVTCASHSGSPDHVATVDGTVDFVKNDARLRGTFVPLYGINNAFGQIPLVGLFLGGQKEGLLGITYEVVGPPSSPTLRVNPISAVAPGLLRKFFEFPNSKPAEPFDAAPQSGHTLNVR